MPLSTPRIPARVRPPVIAPVSTSSVVFEEMVTVAVSSATQVGSIPLEGVNDAGGGSPGPSSGASLGSAQPPCRSQVMPAGHSAPDPQAPASYAGWKQAESRTASANARGRKATPDLAAMEVIMPRGIGPSVPRLRGGELRPAGLSPQVGRRGRED